MSADTGARSPSRAPWTGCGTALVTPFTRAGDLDEAAVTRLARRQIDGGVQFLVPCATTGESPALSNPEKVRVVELTVREADGRIPVLAGAGGYDTRAAGALARDMAQAGADAILSVTPYYNKPTQEGVYRHFTSIAEQMPLPIIVYNIPGRTGRNIIPSTLVRLAEVPQIVGVKESSGDLAQMCEMCAVLPRGFSIVSGDDAFTLPLMALGGSGAISVVANEVPAEMARLVALAAAGDFRSARVVHERLLPLMQANFLETNPIPVKAAMAMLGLLEESYRLPMTPLTDAARPRLEAVLAALGLIPDRDPADR